MAWRNTKGLQNVQNCRKTGRTRSGNGDTLTELRSPHKDNDCDYSIFVNNILIKIIIIPTRYALAFAFSSEPEMTESRVGKCAKCEHTHLAISQEYLTDIISCNSLHM